MPLDLSAAERPLDERGASPGLNLAAAKTPLASPPPSVGGLNLSAAEKPLDERPAPRPKQRQANVTPTSKPYQAPGWDQALHRGMDAVGNELRQFQTARQLTDAANPAIAGLPHANEATNKAVQHAAGTALERIGAWMPTTIAGSSLGSILSDIDPHTPPGAYFADWTRRMLRGDAVGAADEYFPTSGAELKRLDEAKIPVVSAAAHQMRNHPILTGLGTTAALWKAPNIEGQLARAFGAGTKAVAPHVARAAQRAGGAGWRASRLPGTPAGRAAERSAQKVGQVAGQAGEWLGKNLDTPTYSMRKALPENPVQQAIGENQALRYLGADRTGAHEANERTKYAFRPRHQTKLTPGLKPQWVGEGSSLKEQKTAVKLYQAREHLLAYQQAPKNIRNAASWMNVAWKRYKQNPANEQAIIDANMGNVPRDAGGKPVWDAMDVHFAPDEFLTRNSNAAGIAPAEHGEVYAAARSQFQTQYEPDLSMLDPKTAVRISRMAHGIRRQYGRNGETSTALKSADPNLLPSERTGYFPQGNLLEDTQQTAQEGIKSPNRGGRAVRLPYKAHARYGSVAQMEHAGMEPFEGLTPEDAMRVDLQRKWTNIHRTKAFHILSGQKDRWGNDILSPEVYRDPQTGQQIDYAEAQRRAREDQINASLKAAAAHRGDVLNPRTGLPQHFPAQIPNEQAAKERAVQAHNEMKRQAALQNRLGEQGTRFVDRSVNAALRQEEAAEKLAGKTEGHAEAMKGAQYEQTEKTRKALEQEKERTKIAKKNAGERLGNILDEQAAAQAEAVRQSLSSAFYRAQASAKRKIGAATEKGRKTISGRSIRVTNDVEKFQQRQKTLHAYSIDASQAERKRLETIAGKHYVAANDRFWKAVNRYYIGAYDAARRKQFLKLAEQIRADVNRETAAAGEESAVAKRVESQYREKGLGHENYINGQKLKDLGVNIPGVGPDVRISHDAYQFFVDNNVPAKEATDLTRIIQQIDNFGRMGVVYNWVIHGIFNLGSTFIGRTRDIAGLAKAMPMLLGTAVGHEAAWNKWEADNARIIELMKITNAYQPSGFNEQLSHFLPREAERDATGMITGYKPAPKGSESYSKMRRSVTRYGALPWGERVKKAFDDAAEWNRRIVFDRFEKWYAAELFKHTMKELGSPDLAAREVRKATQTDLITPFEQKIMSHPFGFWFYPWFKTFVRFAIATGIHNPSWWNAPLQGARVERENEGAGDIRVGNNPYMIVKKDPKGGFDTYSIPLPQRLLNNFATALTGPVDARDPQAAGRVGALVDIASSRLKPLSSWTVDTAAEAISGGKTPPYMQTFDPNASPLQAVGESAVSLGSRYLNPAVQASRYAGDVGKAPGNALGNALLGVLGISHGYRLPGDVVGRPTPGSPAQMLSTLRGYLRRYQPGAKEANPGAYAQAQRMLDAFYEQYPQAKP